MKTLLTFVLLFPMALTFSQENLTPPFKGGIIISVSPAFQVFDLLKEEDDPGIRGFDFYSAGFVGLVAMNNNVSLETGIYYSRGRIEVIPWGDHPQISNEILTLCSVPVMIRSTFYKYFFISSGFLFDFDFSEPSALHNQSGIGISLGTGFNYDFRKSFSVFINSELRLHSMISYKKVFANQRVFEGAFKLGLLYRIK